MRSTLPMGSATVSAPRPTSSTRWIAAVIGTTSDVTVPSRGREESSTRPPSASMVALTASIPTPRPDTSLTLLRVERPGRNTSAATCSGGRSSARSPCSRPAATARARTVSRSMPPPSSSTEMRIESRSRRAWMQMRPASCLPSRRRSSGPSMPWSTALRIRWTSGSESRSRMERSSSSSAPASSTCTCLPSWRASSRATRGSCSITRSSGAVRRSRARRCSSPTTRSMRSKPLATPTVCSMPVSAAAVRS